MPRKRFSQGVYQVGPDQWRWRVMVNGVRHHGTARTETAAKLARAHAEIDAGGTPDWDPTVSDLLDHHIASSGRAHTTLHNWRWALDAVPQTFLSRNARDINPQLVASLWRTLADQPPHRLVKLCNLCSTAWQDALRLGVVNSNPFRIIPPPSPPPKTDIHPPTPADVRTLIDAADPWFRLWLLIASQTGARGGEVCGLQWSDLDPVTGEILICRNVTRTGEVSGTKTGVKGQRRVPLDDDTLTAWNEHKERTCSTPTTTTTTSTRRTDTTATNGSCSTTSATTRSTANARTPSSRSSSMTSSPWVFDRGDGQPMRPDGAASRLRRLAHHCGIDTSPHDLRHFAVTQWLALGVSIPDVAAMIGDNPKTVMQTYAHHIPTNRRDMVRRLADIVRNAGE